MKERRLREMRNFYILRSFYDSNVILLLQETGKISKRSERISDGECR